jgi:hypothetical protein
VEEGGAVRAVDDLGTKYVIQHPGYSILFYTRSTKRTNRPNQTSRPSPNRARAPHPLTPHVPYPLPAVHIPPTHPEPYPIFFPHDLTGLQRRRRRRFAEVGRRRERRRRSPAAVALEDPPPQAPPAPLLLLRHPARSQGGAGGQLGVSRLQWFTAWKVQPRWRWRVLADSPRTHTGEYLRAVLGFPPYLPVTDVLGFSPSVIGFFLT